MRVLPFISEIAARSNCYAVVALQLRGFHVRKTMRGSYCTEADDIVCGEAVSM
jgi:hypothetical protein